MWDRSCSNPTGTCTFRTWSTVWPGLRAALADMKQFGYCLSMGEFHREINSISVPVVGPSGEVMALNHGAAAHSLPESRLREDMAPLMLALAASISAEIGSGPVAPLN